METTYKHSGKVRNNSHNYYLRDWPDWIPGQLDLRACTVSPSHRASGVSLPCFSSTDQTSSQELRSGTLVRVGVSPVPPNQPWKFCLSGSLGCALKAASPQSPLTGAKA